MSREAGLGFGRAEISLGDKLRQIPWGLVIVLFLTAFVGFAMLYSAANGSYEPWAWRHAARFGVGLALALVVAVIDPRKWLPCAYPIYAIALTLLVVVEVSGMIGLGAQRWVDLWVFQLQPSEVMKVALVLALARYFHGITFDEIQRARTLIVPVLLVLFPTVLVVRQPALGSALLLVATSAALFFLAGVRLRVFAGVLVAALVALPLAWQFLRGYQQERIFTFLNPERDPLGAGYHILQSKIALGSGGMFGKGFLSGTQSHLNFLPEKQTDFIFTMLAEEFGLIGGLVLVGLYALILVYGFAISLSSASQFGRLVGAGITTTFFIYAFVNMAMVTGMVPVVGVPLPLVSYGGSALMTLLIGFGFLMSVYVHRNVTIPHRAGSVV